MELNFLKKEASSDDNDSVIPKPGFVKDLILKGQLARLIVIIFTVVFVIFFLSLALVSSSGTLSEVGSPIDFMVFALE